MMLVIFLSEIISVLFPCGFYFPHLEHRVTCGLTVLKVYLYPLSWLYSHGVGLRSLNPLTY
jgi:hypothetical protein